MAAISSPAFLARVSESARLKNQKIVLRDLKDYFMYVVVPSRANDRVDDIEFIGQNRVKAFTVTEKINVCVSTILKKRIRVGKL